MRYERNGGLEKRRRNPSLSFYPLGPNSFLVGQPVGHRLPVTSRLLYVSWPRMFVKKHGRHQSWGTSVIFFDETAGQATEPSDLRNNDLPYIVLCHRVLLMEKKILVLKRVSNFRNSFCLIQCHSISLTWIYSLFDSNFSLDSFEQKSLLVGLIKKWNKFIFTILKYLSWYVESIFVLLLYI